MGDDDKSKGWWQTLPGIIAGVTGVITAVAGLIVAVNQTGWFAPRDGPAVTSPPSASVAPPGSTAPAEPARDRPAAAPPPAAPATSPPTASVAPPPMTAATSPSAVSATSPSTASATTYAVALPDMREYTLGPRTSSATFTLLRADVLARTAEKPGLDLAPPR